jgi:hypothetical protein
MSSKRPTERQKRALLMTFENLGKTPPMSKQEILLQSGYSPAIAKNPEIVYGSKYFQAKLKNKDDTLIVDRFYKIALESEDNRAALQAGKEILTLKNRYPKETIDVELSMARKEVIEPD